VIGLINADAAQRDAENGVIHFCKDCLELPEEEVVARLNERAGAEAE
jgi:hypothetical protein